MDKIEFMEGFPRVKVMGYHLQSVVWKTFREVFSRSLVAESPFTSLGKWLGGAGRGVATPPQRRMGSPCFYEILTGFGLHFFMRRAHEGGRKCKSILFETTKIEFS